MGRPCYACGRRGSSACRLCRSDACARHAGRTPSDLWVCGDCARAFGRGWPPVYAHWQGRTYPVCWPSYRPEPELGDLVRLDVGCQFGWRSFRVVGRRERTEQDQEGTYRVGLDLDVEPASRAD